MKKWKVGLPSWLFWPLEALAIFVFSEGICLMRGQPADIPAWAAIACIFTLLTRMFSGPMGDKPKVVPEAESHDHDYRLRYVGGMNGFRIVCNQCGRRWLLHEDYAFFMRGGVWVLGIAMSFLHVWVSFLRLPEPWDILRIPVCLVAAMYIVHGVTWLLLRRRELSLLIAGETDGGDAASETPAD